jgi:hypothetical protein
MATFETIMESLGVFPIFPDARYDPSEAELSAFENDIGGTLPADYREFLTRFGGTGLRTSPRFRIKEPTPLAHTASLSEFYGFSRRAGQSIVALTMETYAGRIPDPTIPIGGDAQGNLVLLGFTGPFVGRVYFWDHEFRAFGGDLAARARELERRGVDTTHASAETIARDAIAEERAKPVGFENVYAVAPTFTAFLTSLEPDPRYR